MRQINYIELGATLFIPATHKTLFDVVSGKKYSELKSVLIDTEDGVKQGALQSALTALQTLLNNYEKKELLVFVRPRNIKILKEILTFDDIEKIDGFILPKFSLSNAEKYFELLEPYDFSLMPSIEGSELFNHTQLNRLRDIILTNRNKIVLVRYGLEDMLKALSLRRGCDESIFDFSATACVIGNFIATFKSSGFAVSGGVYPCFKDEKRFVKDVQKDLKEGLFSKTIIHPSQIALTNELYKVTQKEFDEALEICKHEDALFAQNGKMVEVTTMLPHSKEIILRAEVYGISPLP